MRFSQKQMLTAVAIIAAILYAKKKKAAVDPTKANNTVGDAGQWWSYAGSWQT